MNSKISNLQRFFCPIWQKQSFHFFHNYPCFWQHDPEVRTNFIETRSKLSPWEEIEWVDRQEQKYVPILLGFTYGPNNTDLNAVKVREETFWQFSRRQFVWKCAYHSRYQLPRYLLPHGAKRKFTSKCFDALVAEATMFLNCFVMPLQRLLLQQIILHLRTVNTIIMFSIVKLHQLQALRHPLNLSAWVQIIRNIRGVWETFLKFVEYLVLYSEPCFLPTFTPQRQQKRLFSYNIIKHLILVNIFIVNQ